jgi:MerR family transcriptional regulator, light-induced transcriptional regulator
MRGQEPHVQPPSLEGYSDLPLFNTKAVVHQTGVPAPTLRAWERRYGILSPRRGDNDYRLYSERDIITVGWLRERVQSGMTISQAIALLKSLEPARRARRRAARAAQIEPHGNGHVAGSSVAVVAQPTVGRYSMEELRATLLHQLASLDEFAAQRTIAQTMAVYPVEDVCQQLLTPVMVDLGRLWVDAEVTVAVEHFATCVIRAQLDSIFRSTGVPDSGPLALVGCAPGELHELGALMLALFLRRAGLHVAYLGQTIEIDGLVETVTAVHPRAILLSATLRPHAEALVGVGERLAALPQPQPLFGFGGQAFVADPGLASAICGLFLGSDAQTAVHDMRKRLFA